MPKSAKIIVPILLALGIIVLAGVWLSHADLIVLNPKGWVGLQERALMATTIGLMLVVVIPVFVMTGFIAWRYRAGNTAATYAPDWDHNLVAETIWWAIPILLIATLSILAWTSSHRLDPFRPLESTVKPVTVQVVALQWKWLFIYPEEHIATVNYLKIPQGTPINFVITSDAPMNSFWIPQLGGQVYAMSGMSTKLHLIADEPGTYRGVSANLSGDGFAGMKFDAIATSRSDYDAWVKQSQDSLLVMDQPTYDALAHPSSNTPQATFSRVAPGLYDRVVMQYMAPGALAPTTDIHPADMHSMEMP